MKSTSKQTTPVLRLILRITYFAVIASMAAALILGAIDGNWEMCLSAIATIGLVFLPMVFRKIKIVIPPLLELMCILFLFASVTLAKMFDFYTLIPCWDLILHFFSGPLMTAIGISLLGLWHFGDKGTSLLPPLFIALFGFFFSMTAAGLWEFYEFSFDTFAGTQMQKFEVRNGIVDTGLLDTMTDMIVAAIGSAAYSVCTWLDLRFKNGKITKRLYLKRI